MVSMDCRLGGYKIFSVILLKCGYRAKSVSFMAQEIPGLNLDQLNYHWFFY